MKSPTPLQNPVYSSLFYFHFLSSLPFDLSSGSSHTAYNIRLFWNHLVSITLLFLHMGILINVSV